MRRDFTEATRLKMLEYVEEVKNDGAWDSFLDFFGDAWLKVKHFFVYTLFGSKPDTAEELEKYHKEVIDKADALAEEVNAMFKLANEADEKYAGIAVNLESAGQDLLTLLQEFTEMAEKGDLSAALSPEKLEEITGLESRIIFKRAIITDQELIQLCLDELSPGLVFNNCVIAINDALAEMSVGTAFLIALFNHDDILLGKVLSTDYGQQVRKNVCDMMLEGKEGLTNPAEIAKALGIDEDAVLYYLKNGNLNGYYNSRRPDVREGFQPYDTRLDSPMRIAQLNTSIEEYIKKNIDTALKDETLCASLCEHLGVNKETVEAMINGKIDAYQMSLYKDSIMRSVEGACEYMDITGLSETDKIIKGISDFLKNPNDSYKIATLLSEEKGKELSKMWENGILSDKEARRFLKDYCGFNEASSDAIKTLRNLTGLMNISKDVSKYLKNASNAAETLEFWLSDYSAEVDMLDKLMEANNDPTYTLAMKELRDEYTHKFATKMEDEVEKLIKKGVDEAKKAVTPLLTVAETAIDLGGEVTGAKGHTDAAQQILAYSCICPQSISAYEQAVAAVKANPADEKALTQVKTTFSMMKQTLVDYYDVQTEYYDGYAFGIGRDRNYQAYLNYQKTKLENLQLGDKFEPISYDKFMEDFGG